MLYNEKDIVKNISSINDLSDKLPLDRQQARSQLLKYYKELLLSPVLLRPGKKNPVLTGWPNLSPQELWNKQKDMFLGNYNVALRLDNFVVIDVDDPVLAQEKLSDIVLSEKCLIVYRGDRKPEDVKSFKEKGHIYFKRPEWFKNTMKFNDLGIELRGGTGSICVIPDSIHPDGDMYKWENMEMLREGLPEFSRDLYEAIISKSSESDSYTEASVDTTCKESATELFFENKRKLDLVLIEKYGFLSEEGAYTQGGNVISQGINYKGNCPRADRHTDGKSTSGEFILHLSYSGQIKKYCHHTHCIGVYQEKLSDLFQFNADTSIFNITDIPEGEKTSDLKGEVEEFNPYSEYMELAVTVSDIRNAGKEVKNKSDKCFAVIVNYLEENGRFIKDSNNNHYYFDRRHNLTCKIDQEDYDYTSFLHKLGIAINEPLAKTLTNRLKNHCHIAGKQVDIKKLSFYNKKTFTIYLDMRNSNNEILKVAPDNITIVDNGTDGVMFLKSRGTPIVIDLPLNVNTNKIEEIILNRINWDIEETNLMPEEQKLIFKIFFLSLFFESIFPTKPILVLIGKKGGGKSFSLRIMGKFLFGQEWDLSSAEDVNERDIKVACLHNTFVGIDNADSYIPWLNNFLAKIATGIKFDERKMRTNNEYIVMKPQCFLGLTARTPKFRRDDIADRLLILKVKPFGNNFLPESNLLEELEDNRDILWSELINLLQMILRKLKDNNNQRYYTSFRMADFYGFACKISDEDVINNIFDKMRQEQVNFSLEEDPIYELLQLYIEDEETSEGEFLTGKDLFSRLRTIADYNRIKFSCETVMSLATKLRHLWEGLQTKFDCKVEKKHGLTYSFMRKKAA